MWVKKIGRFLGGTGKPGAIIAGLLASLVLLSTPVTPTALADVTNLPHSNSVKIAVAPQHNWGSVSPLPRCDQLPSLEELQEQFPDKKLDKWPCEDEALDPKTVKSAEDLKKYDTIVLYQFCDIGDPNYDLFRSSLIEWLKIGGKLIIMDSDSCNKLDGTRANYSWLGTVEADFESDTPGQTGQHSGRLEVVEENHLSSAVTTSAFYIDTNAIVRDTDAVGDMNVIITFNRAWCADLEGENIHEVSGYAHAYTRPGFQPLGNGWIIYNALDTDYFDISEGLRKIYLLELLHGWGGRREMADLGCKVPVLGKFCTSPARDRFIELEKIEIIFSRLLRELYDQLDRIKDHYISGALYLLASGGDRDQITKLLENAGDTMEEILKDTGDCDFEEEEEGGKLQVLGCLKIRLQDKKSQVEKAVRREVEEGIIGELRGERILRRLDEVNDILDDIELELESMREPLEQVASLLEDALSKVRRGNYRDAARDLDEALAELRIALQSKGSLLDLMARKASRILQVKQDLFAAERACRRSALREREMVLASELNAVPLVVTGVRISPNPMGRGVKATFRAMGTGIEGIRVQVFDLSGRAVFDRETSGGVTSLIFDGLDQKTKAPLANGVYLYLVTVRGRNGEIWEERVRKLVILR
jgi:hypothetical protein